MTQRTAPDAPAHHGPEASTEARHQPQTKTETATLTATGTKPHTHTDEAKLCLSAHRKRATGGMRRPEPQIHCPEPVNKRQAQSACAHTPTCRPSPKTVKTEVPNPVRQQQRQRQRPRHQPAKHSAHLVCRLYVPACQASTAYPTRVNCSMPISLQGVNSRQHEWGPLQRGNQVSARW